MPKVKRQVPPLPTLGEFALSSIMEGVPATKTEALKRSIEATNDQYATDIGDQMNQLVEVEQGILLKLESVDHEYKVLHTKLDLDVSEGNDGDRIQLYSKIGNKFGTIVNGIIDQRKRIDKLTTRLKQIDRKVLKGDGSSLFDLHSENKDKFKELYNLGMKDEPITVNTEIPKVKLQQYLDIEMQLEEIGREQSKKKYEKFKNPTTGVILNESATTGVSDEIVTITQREESETGTETVLLNELKKFHL